MAVCCRGWLDANAEHNQTDGVVQTPQPSAPGTPATPTVAQPTATTTSQALREMAAAGQAQLTGLAQALERSNESEVRHDTSATSQPCLQTYVSETVTSYRRSAHVYMHLYQCPG